MALTRTDVFSALVELLHVNPGAWGTSRADDLVYTLVAGGMTPLEVSRSLRVELQPPLMEQEVTDAVSRVAIARLVQFNLYLEGGSL